MKAEIDSMELKAPFQSSSTRRMLQPIIKWAGGKSQLLATFGDFYPKELGGSIRRFSEPFVGGGAVFLDIYSKGLIDEALLIDSNKDLVDLYQTVKSDTDDLLDQLAKLKVEYLALDEEGRSQFFYAARDDYNKLVSEETACKVKKSALLIFLNKTCFNGLFRVNSKGMFNVPFGRYQNPLIFSITQIRLFSEALKIAEIQQGDFCSGKEWCLKGNTFVYFDPPYRPLNTTSSFTAYSKVGFNDSEQERLASYFAELSNAGCKLMLSNSDPYSASGDAFFERLYREFNINRVDASRAINSNASKRGNIKELLVTNYCSAST